MSRKSFVGRAMGTGGFLTARATAGLDRAEPRPLPRGATIFRRTMSAALRWALRASRAVDEEVT